MALVGFQYPKHRDHADDFVILCRAATNAAAALRRVQVGTAEAGLTWHPEKTRLVDLNGPDGFDFLGYHFQRDRHRPGRFYRWPRKKSVQKLKDTLRAKTPRVSGQSLRGIITRVNRTLRGWLEYFQHTNVATVFPELDGWLRRRLRRILLKRHKQHDHQGRGLAHRRWPHAYFAEQGLYSLALAHAAVRRSARR